MAQREHHYTAVIEWTGNKGQGTTSYQAYERSYDVHVEGKPTLHGSSDPRFRGDPARYNPEDLLLAALSACHMLWYLHLCAAAKVVVTAYRDRAEGFMTMNPDGSGQFTRVVLRPEVTISSGDPETARRLHHEASAKCFIARSVNFPVEHEPTVRVETASAEAAG